ncbi:MAG TPA: Gfo/Idh/MocA family oxidoreductase [Bacteroidota bacterium]|nr:Gfo/Idh/MocA family oxidoreductase [Bacteroidota bacterium]
MERTIRWGILGTGWIAEKMAEALTFVEGAELSAVASRTQARADEFARRHGAGTAHGSYEALARDPAVDVVYVATPHTLHCENSILCLRNGKAVLCEKPFAMNEKEVVRMIAAAREHDLFLMEAFWTRFLPSIDRVMQVIASGALGRVRHIHSDHAKFRPFDPLGRLFNKSLGGGSLLDIGIYPVFLTLLLWGEPDEIGAVPQFGPTGVDESLALTFRYSDGRIATLYSSFMVDSTVETEICGSEGRLHMHRWWFCPVPVDVIRGEDPPETIPFDYVGNGYNYEAAEVVRCLRAGLNESPALTLDFSLRLIRLLDRIRAQIGLTYDADLAR